MNFLQALEIAIRQPELCFRPVAWRGYGMAYLIKNGRVELMPKIYVGQSMTCIAHELAGDWETGEFPDLIKNEMD